MMINIRAGNLGRFGFFSSLLVAGARENGQARIFRESGIAPGKRAQQKDGSAVRFHRTRVNTIRAKPRALLRQFRLGRIRHAVRITHVFQSEKNEPHRPGTETRHAPSARNRYAETNAALADHPPNFWTATPRATGVSRNALHRFADQSRFYPRQFSA